MVSFPARPSIMSIPDVPVRVLLDDVPFIVVMIGASLTSVTVTAMVWVSVNAPSETRTWTS